MHKKLVIQQKFEFLFEEYGDQLKSIKKQPNQVALGKILTNLKSEVFKALKNKRRTSTNNKNSGFLKEVKVSDLLSDFLNADNIKEPLTRSLLAKRFVMRKK